MIHEYDGKFVISSRSSWMPGVYKTKRAANLAFRLPDETLKLLQEQAGVGGVIEYDSILRAYREYRRGK